MPAFACDQSWTPESNPIQCLMAMGDLTDKPPMLVQMFTGDRRTANADERDRMMGTKAGFTCAFGKVPLDDSTRNRGNGNMSSLDSLWHIIREWKPRASTVPHSLMTADDIYAADPITLEKYFASLNVTGDPETVLVEWALNFTRKHCKTNGTGDRLDMPVLHLIPKADQTVPHQISHAGHVPARLAPSAAYQIDKMLRDGTHVEINYSPDLWISLLFFQPKGRTEIAKWDGDLYKAGDELESLRPLKDMRAVNAAHFVPTQWSEHSPDRMVDHRKIPDGTTMYKKLDSEAAYHATALSEATQEMCACQATLLGKICKLLMSKFGVQGLAAMGAFFPVWTHFGYCTLFGRAWYEW